ncbi:MAG: hypothetical protein ACYC35_08120 [Pirellulales bacterium]
MSVGRCLAGLVAWVLLLAGSGPVDAEQVVSFSFDEPVPGTISGSGFTSRLPGTGEWLPEPDVNLDWWSQPGSLTIRSTVADLNVANNLGELEMPGVVLTNLGRKDLVIEALFRNIQLDTVSDQLLLYAGVSKDMSVRAGFAFSNPGYDQYYGIVGNLYGADDSQWASPGQAFSSGDDVRVTLSRRSGLWGLSWDNLTRGDRGTSPWFSYPWLEDEYELYLGFCYASPKGFSQTSLMDDFSVSVAPYEAGDTDKDHDVDVFDVAAIQVNYGSVAPDMGWEQGDFDGDHDVDIFDVMMMQRNFGRGVSQTPLSVPEPSGLLLGLLAAIGLGIGRRRQRRAG